MVRFHKRSILIKLINMNAPLYLTAREAAAELSVSQATLYARATGTRDALSTVEVGGSAVTVARGEFRLPT